MNNNQETSDNTAKMREALKAAIEAGVMTFDKDKLRYFCDGRECALCPFSSAHGNCLVENIFNDDDDNDDDDDGGYVRYEGP